MPDLILYSAIFVISLAVLIKSSDYFTDAAEKFGLLIGLSPFIIGVTIVSIGTSLPELISSLFAVWANSSEIVIGNVVGSNIANIFLVIGAASVISYKQSINITYNLIRVDLPLFVGSALLLALEVWDRKFTKGEAWLLLLAYLMYTFYTLNGTEEQEATENDSEEPIKRNSKTVIIQLLIIIISAIFLYLGAKYTIDYLVKISEVLDIGKEIIAVTAVALGTSLPELIVTVNASLKGKAELAVGNVLGSNVFNTFVVMGVPGLIGTLTIPKTVIMGGLPTMIAGTILLFFVAQDQQLTVWEGWLFFIFYGWFIGQTFGLL
ncbi:MAG: calcium/sodium antiporter [Prochloron sp. SP5CPC1]|nr:calcium/sodium antiporter [Candidatus Paraprochloron terpiosi SP5CPC1]